MIAAEALAQARAAGIQVGIDGDDLALEASARPPGFFLVYGVSLLFFLPVFVFSSPYAAVAGMTVAHGYQYLLILGLLACMPRSIGAHGRRAMAPPATRLRI